MQDLLAHYEKVFGEEKFEVIKKGFEEGLTADQVALYARPDLYNEQMDVLRCGIKGGMSYEQVNFVIDLEGDWTEMQIQCIGFLLGMSIGEMSSIVNNPNYHEKLDSRIEELLDEFATKKLPIANEICSSYQTNLEGVSSGAVVLLQAFYAKYINEGYKYSGSIQKEDIFKLGCRESELKELLEKGVVKRRDCIAESYELTMMERYCLIKDNDVLEKWDKHGGVNFRLNNGYYGEFHRVLREVLNSRVVKKELVKKSSEHILSNISLDEKIKGVKEKQTNVLGDVKVTNNDKEVSL